MLESPVNFNARRYIFPFSIDLIREEDSDARVSNAGAKNIAASGVHRGNSLHLLILHIQYLGIEVG